MKDEKKVKATEEEAKKEEHPEEEGVELTDEELEQVTGGFEPGSYAQIRLPTYAIDY